jgi:hypothetical protein
MESPGKEGGARMIYRVPIPGVFEGKEINRFPGGRWVYPIPIQNLFHGKTVFRFPRAILAGDPLIVGRDGTDWKPPVQIGKGRGLTFKGR